MLIIYFIGISIGLILIDYFAIIYAITIFVLAYLFFCLVEYKIDLDIEESTERLFKIKKKEMYKLY